jgi:molybdate transport system ATP-binding protein
MLTVTDLSVGILQRVNLTLGDKSCTAVCGSSGSGKTTLLNAIVGVKPYQGSISIDQRCIDGKPVWRRPCRYLNQQLYLFPHLSIDNNLRIAQYAAGLTQDRQARLDILERLEIKALAKRYPWQISGGEQQRAALARALIAEHKLLLLDEPFSHLDWPMRKRLWQLLNTLREQLSLSVLLVTHEPKEAEALAQRCLTLQKGTLS